MLSSSIITCTRVGASYGIPAGIFITFIIMGGIWQYNIRRVFIQGIIYYSLVLFILGLIFSLISFLANIYGFIILIQVITTLILADLLANSIYNLLVKTKVIDKIWNLRKTRMKEVED